MYTYVTKDLENSHPANPKPLYKTHKEDDNGNMLTPPPIRLIQAACGTPVHPLSKVGKKSIEQLTSEQELLRRNGSTTAVLK